VIIIEPKIKTLIGINLHKQPVLLSPIILFDLILQNFHAIQMGIKNKKTQELRKIFLNRFRFTKNHK